MPPSISLIAALANNRVIGKDNTLPWRLSVDLKNFKQLTLKKAVIMGRKTFESIGKPLPDRLNIILTHQPTYSTPGCIIVHSPEEAIASASSFEEIMIIGGAEIYQLFLPQAQRMYLTLIHADIKGDTYFPAWNEDEWQETSRENYEAIGDIPSYSFVKLIRKISS